jgi:hypothetical protein
VPERQIRARRARRRSEIQVGQIDGSAVIFGWLRQVTADALDFTVL